MSQTTPQIVLGTESPEKWIIRKSQCGSSSVLIVSTYSGYINNKSLGTESISVPESCLLLSYNCTEKQLLCGQLGRCKSGWLCMEEGWPSAAPVFWSAVWMENRILSYLMIYVKTPVLLSAMEEKFSHRNLHICPSSVLHQATFFSHLSLLGKR